MSGTAQPAGVEFGPTQSGKMYLSVYAHRGANPRKSCWAPDVTPPDEYSIFEAADNGQRSDANGHYWGVRDFHGAVLGTRGERLAKFPCNAVESAPWHGFPVSPSSGRDSEIPPDDLVAALIAAKAITRTFGRKIQRRKA